MYKGLEKRICFLPLQNRLNPSGLQSYRELYTSRNCLSISPGDKLRNRVKDSYTVSTGRRAEEAGRGSSCGEPRSFSRRRELKRGEEPEQEEEKGRCRREADRFS